MARISLRAYNQEIESLIDRGHYEQAIAHCRHILRYFNKHINTYRLLGKAFLESQRYGDAADIFQRVLSSIPDDFVSHVGMSIIREDEGNLDEALWHIERAYEVQPGNKAIQGELRRLYGRKDGMEPPKVQLTRGALARMYLKGELYQQAISELRPAISQSRQRPDLLVVLARAYYLSGQRVPAADTCSSLLKKYPYCLEANRILADILADSERAEEAKVYFNRAIALDPYLAQVSSRASTADQVPEAAVVLEKLDWTQESAKAAVPSQPEWATSLGVEVDDLAAKDDSLPEWLSSTSDEEDIPADTSQDEVSEEAPIEAAVVGDDVAEQPLLPEDDTTPEEIPDWMKDAGWEPASGDVDKSAALPDFIDEEISSDELAPADMPDWIQDMAPEHTTSEDQPEQEEAAGEEEVLPADAEVLPWLAEEPPGPTDSVVTFLEDKESPLPESSEIDLDSDESVDIPDWLQDFEEEPQVESDIKMDASPPDLPPADAGEVTVGEELPVTSDDMVPDELVEPEMAAETTEPLDDLEATPAEGLLDEEIPQWMADLKAAAGDTSQPEVPAEEIPSDEEVPAWLTGLAAKQVSETMESMPEAIEPEGEIPVDAEPFVEEVPQWLSEADEKPTEEVISEDLTPAIFDTEGESDWSQEFEADSGDEITVPEDVPEVEDLAVEPPAAEEISADLPTEVEAVGVETTAEGPAFELSEEPETEVAESGEAIEPDSIDDDEAFAWLESLAAKQGATEAMLLSPDERQEEPPDWVQQATPTPDITEEVGEEAPKGEDEALPDWLSVESPLEEPVSELAEDKVKPSEELPNWLESDVEETALIASEDELEPETDIDIEEEPEVEPEGEVPSWLQAGAVAAGAAAVGAAISSSDDEPIDEQEAPVDELAAEAEMEYSLEADEDESVTEEVETGIPDWLQEVTEVTPDTEPELSLDEEIDTIAEQEEQVSAQPADVPDWLQEVTEAAPFDEEVDFAVEGEEQVEAQPAEVPEWIKEISPEPTEIPSTEEALIDETEEEMPVSEIPATALTSEMFFAPSILSLQQAKAAVDEETGEQEESEEEPAKETLVIDEAPVIEGDTAPTQVTLPDQIPVPPTTIPEPTEAALPVEEDFDAEIPSMEVPEWLQDVEVEVPSAELPEAELEGAETAELEADIDTGEIDEALEGIPDWLSDLDVEAPEETLVTAEAEAPAIEEVAPETPPEPAAEVTPEDAVVEDDDAFAWLESLAAKQGAEEALLLSPEERREEPPDWVEKAAAEGDEAAISDEIETVLDEDAEEPDRVEAYSETDEQIETALDISDEETIPLEELKLDVPDLDTIPGEEIVEEVGAQPEETDLSVTPKPLNDLTVEEEIPTQIDGYAQTQPLPDLSEILGEEPIALDEEAPLEAVEPEAEVLAQELPDTVDIEEKIPDVGEVEPVSETLETAEEPPAGVPDLPDWLADVEEETAEEIEDEWTPSEELLAQTGALEEVVAIEPEDRPLDINKAGLADFERLSGVGFIKAQAIIEHREVHGPYTNINDLQDVPGLGPAMVDEIRELITVEVPEEPIVEGPSDEQQVILIQARNSLIKGDNKSAIEYYQALIDAEQLLPEVIQDLNDALYRFPMEVLIWQTLGDAHVRLGQLQEALDAYTKAEELLR